MPLTAARPETPVFMERDGGGAGRGSRPTRCGACPAMSPPAAHAADPARGMPAARPAATGSAGSARLRGRWLDRASLESQLLELADLYATVPAVARDPSLPDAEWIAGFLGKLRQLKELGYVFPERHLEEMSLALRRLATLAKAAARVYVDPSQALERVTVDSQAA
jgi:hypothetical protein